MYGGKSIKNYICIRNCAFLLIWERFFGFYKINYFEKIFLLIKKLTL
jgi:hypothetical protein